MSLPTTQRFRFYAMYWPLQWSFGGVLLIALGIYYFLQQHVGDKNYTGDVLLLAGKIVGGVALLLLAFSLCMLLFALLFFIGNQKKVHAFWNKKQLVVEGLVQPLLGFVRVHLLHQFQQSSEMLLLMPHSNAGVFFFKGSMASSPLSPSDVVRAESIDGMMIHFEDPFRFFSVSFYIPIQLERLRLPDAEAASSSWLTLLHPDRAEQHTQTVQRRPGDWFRLKTFESGDDVRRVVWRLYAKHHELMVRQQDDQHPYGDALRVITLFDSKWNLGAHPALSMYLETRYKQKVFALLCGLLNEGATIDWRTLSTDWVNHISIERLGEALSRGTWETSEMLTPPNSTPIPSLVFLSSIADVFTLEKLAKQWPNTLFVLIDVFDTMHHRSWRKRLNALFVKPHSMGATTLLDRWWRHPMRGRMLKNRKQLQQALSNTCHEGGVYV